MRIKQPLWTAVAVCALLSGANASLLTWVDRNPDTGNGPLQFLSENGTKSYSSFFDITTAGFVPGTHSAGSIDVKFAFADDQFFDVAETVDITFGGLLIWDDEQVDGTFLFAPTYYDWVSGSLTVNLALLGDLNADGKLAYTVTIQDSNRGTADTWLKIAELTAAGSLVPGNNGNAVPDGGATLGLFGLGLLGLGAICRKLS
jgi:hypothetical protein